jgi:hypothetical protein
VEKLKGYYKEHDNDKQQFANRTSLESLEREFNLEKSEIIVLKGFFHKEASLLKDYPNDKYISVLPVKEFFTELIHQKIHSRQGSSGHPQIRADYMLIETVAYD